jgi:cytochrome c553
MEADAAISHFASVNAANHAQLGSPDKHRSSNPKKTITGRQPLLVPAVAHLSALAIAGFGSLAAATPVGASEPPPAWAYPVVPPGLQPAPDDGVSRRVPDSNAAFTLTQIRDLHFAPDWHPEDHPPMPDIVARGGKQDVLACGSCHRADGSGGPENAKISGLPAAYIAQQMADIKNGSRKTAVPERAPPQLMISTAKAISDQEIEASAAYFSALQPRQAVRVVEAESVPKTYVTGWHLAVAPGQEQEPLGQRIIEVPEDLESFSLRDGRARFVAYVPAGSPQRGQVLATSGGDKTVACGSCHGPDLKGMGPIPGIAGRSPSYVVRQLYDFKTGARAGLWSALMKPVTEKLSMDDMVDLAAYAATLRP